MKNQRPNALLTELSKPLQENVPLSAAAMQTLIDAEKKRAAAANEDFSCELMDAENKNVFNELSASIQALSADAETPLRLQRIIKDGAHYTTVDILLSKDGNRFLMLDSAGDPRCFSHYQKLMRMQIFKQGIIAAPEPLSKQSSGAPQDDSFSCGAFAFDFACQCAHLANLHDAAAKHAKHGMIAWHQLPPQLVWNCQSKDWLTHYMKLCHADDKAIIMKYLGPEHLQDKSMTSRAIQTSFARYQAQAREFLHAPEASLERMKFSK